VKYFPMSSLSIGATLVKASLAKCQMAALNLETSVNATSKRLNEKKILQVVQRAKAAIKKADIKELNVHLDEAKNLLHLALDCYGTHDTRLYG
jgi:hypothetical protein